MNPRVSVVMTSYNREEFLLEAIDSILSQTFQDFEFIIVDDASSASTRSLLADYARRDKRIVLVFNQENMGNARSSNKGLKIAVGEYIARMDSDDISLPHRLERQVAFMDAHPQVGICGSSIRYFGTRRRVWHMPPEDAQIKCALPFYSPIAHPAAIFRRAVFVAHNLAYNVEFKEAEDYELWIQAAKVTALANVPEVLLHYRSHDQQAGTLNREIQTSLADTLRLEQLAKFGLQLTDEEKNFHLTIAKLANSMTPMTRDEVVKADLWLQKLQSVNQSKKVFPEPMFTDKLNEQWFALCFRANHLNLYVWVRYWQSPLSHANTIPLVEHAKFLVHCASPWFRKIRKRQALKRSSIWN